MRVRPPQDVDHLLVETKGGERGEAAGLLEIAPLLTGDGSRVVVVLMQDAAVDAAVERRRLRHAMAAGVTVLVDGFSLRQRAVRDSDVAQGVGVVDADEVAGLLLVPGVKVVWH
ncbi:hypothetical protein [Streptomyces sp. NPDC048191]|uniref:hypothetical protein n=1 Tax=Streptomyces sp. NPDC048191 TaxID=3155484 RepID=UPI0033E92666